MMMYKCFLDLDVGPAWNFVKVDDTEAGIAEGPSAGSWTVGVSLSGNAPGLSRDELAALTPAGLDEARARARPTLDRAKAHFVIDSIADLEPILDQIEGRLARGERP
jgi:phosphonoacetaldehyde hydrolase